VKLSFWRGPSRPLIILIALVVTVSLLAACAGGSSTGSTSGGAFGCGGSTSGEKPGSGLYAINIASRSDNQTYPALQLGEWRYNIVQEKRASGCGSSGSSTSAGGCGTCSTFVYWAGPAVDDKIVYVPAKGITGMYAAPVIGGDLLYLTSYDGKVIALDKATGGESDVLPKREGETFGPFVGTPIFADNMLYATNSDGNLYSFKTLDEKARPKLTLRWKVQTDGRAWASPAVSGKTVFAGNLNGKAMAVSTEGEKLWTVDLKSAVSTVAAAGPDLVIFGCFDRILYALNTKDGSIAWQFSANNWFWSPPAIQQGVIYAACLDGKVFAIDLKTGKQLWVEDTGSAIAFAPIITGDSLMVAPRNNGLMLLNLADGQAKKKISLGATVLSQPAVRGDVAYVVLSNDDGSNDRLRAVNMRTGINVTPRDVILRELAQK
jgi:outer membrane protein assembly factor BamB